MPRDPINKRFSEFKNARKYKAKRAIASGNRSKKYRDSINEAISLKQKYAHLLKCTVCKEDRVIELCHIVPVKLDGDGSPFNLLVLCPTHHKLFDDAKLHEHEYEMLRDKIHLGLKYHCLNMVA